MSLELQIKKRMGDFSLDVCLSPSGTVTGILGPSGCGKSLTLQMLAGVRTPDSGRIVLNDCVLFDSRAHINVRPQKRRVGYLFQNYALFPTMSVARNIACGISSAVPRVQRKAMVYEWMENMRLDRSLATARPWELSGGQQQRVALARVLISQPQILLLDEPFSALDTYLRERMVAEVREMLQRADCDALLVTHNRDEAYELCSSVAIMDKGSILEWGATKDVFSHPQTSLGATVTGCKNIETAQKTGAHELFVPAWGASFKTKLPVPDDVCAIGLRAHYFSPEIEENRYPVEIVEEVEEPFAWIVGFRYQGASANTPAVWWRLSKDHPEAADRRPQFLGIAPDDVLVLRP